MLDEAFYSQHLIEETEYKDCSIELSNIFLGGKLESVVEAYLEYVRGDGQEKEPQPKINNIGVCGVKLPDVLNTDRVKNIFQSAYNKGWMIVDGNRYKWIGLKDADGNVVRGKGQQFAYLMGQMFGYKKKFRANTGNNIPCRAIEVLFGEYDIYKKLIKCWEGKPQSWRPAIDDMIKAATIEKPLSTSN